eukprot:2742688-Rhodomonas_salina.2
MGAKSNFEFERGVDSDYCTKRLSVWYNSPRETTVFDLVPPVLSLHSLQPSSGTSQGRRMADAFTQDAKNKATEYLEAQKHYYKQLSDEKNELRRFKASRDEHKDAIKLLQDAPLKTRHEIMVPFGDLAFMPGELVHTNEVMVLLGDNYFVETSAHHASEILERRVQVVDDMISKTEKKVKDLAMRCDLSVQARNAVLSTLSAETVKTNPKSDATAKNQAKPSNQTPADEEEEEEEEDEDDDEGKGPEYWNAAGFVGCFADDVEGAARQDDEQDEEEEEEEEEERKPQTSAVAGIGADEEEWDDDAPVVEIYEPLDGGDCKVVKHGSQKEFEQSPSFPY